MIVRSRDFVSHGCGSVHISGRIIAQVEVDIIVIVIFVLSLLLVVVVAVTILIRVVGGLFFDMRFGLRRSWGRGLFNWLLLLRRGRRR